MTPPEILLSLVIPTFNEAAVINDSIRKTLTYLCRQEISFELIISDDGSTDGTPDIVSTEYGGHTEVVLIKLPHKGKGHAIKEGFQSAQGTYMLFMDADLSTPLDAITPALALLQEGAEIAVGSRRARPIQVAHRQPVYRHWAGTVFARLSRLLLGLKIRDPQCGFKAFQRDVALQLCRASQLNGFAFDTELLYLAKKQNHTIKEFAVAWQDDGNSSVRFLRDGAAMFLDLLRIFLKHYDKQSDTSK